MGKWLALLLVIAGARVWAATYYIDFAAANDAADGTSKATPWKHHPSMAGWTGSYSHSAGDRFIFKGGVEWDSASLPVTINSGGSPGNPDYYGVDKTWYSGPSWTKPLFNNKWKHGSIFYIRNNNLTFDYFETKNITYSSADYGKACFSFDGSIQNITIKNCLIHGWVITDTSAHANGAGGGIICGSTNAPVNNCRVDSCEVHNMEYSGTPNGYPDSLGVINCGDCIDGVAWVTHSRIHDASSGLLHVTNAHHNKLYNICYPVQVFNDPDKHGFASGSHTNVMFMDGNDTIRCHHNYLANNNALSNIIMCPNWGNTSGKPNDCIALIYDNVLIGLPNLYIDIQVVQNHEQTDTVTDTCGSTYIYNNTFGTDGRHSQWVYVSQSNPNGKTPNKAFKIIDMKNNLYVCNDSSQTYNITAHVVSQTISNNYWMHPDTATRHGFTLSDTFKTAQTPPAGMQNGANFSAVFTNDYNDNPRPASGAWDIGAYEYGSTGVRRPKTEDRKDNKIKNMVFSNPSFSCSRSPGIYDLSGHLVNKSAIIKNGIYILVNRDGHNRPQKVMEVCK